MEDTGLIPGFPGKAGTCTWGAKVNRPDPGFLSLSVFLRLGFGGWCVDESLLGDGRPVESRLLLEGARVSNVTAQRLVQCKGLQLLISP